MRQIHLVTRFFALLLLVMPLWSGAAIDTYEFKDEASRERFHQLTEELRCPKCQNQNLADSDSPIAADLRREVYRMVSDGQSDGDIIDFMVARYGEFVRYNPRIDSDTYVLWFGPVVLFLIGALVVVLIARRKRRLAQDAPAITSEQKQQRLKELLKDVDD